MTIGNIIGSVEIWGPQLSRVVCLICLQVSTFLSVHFLDGAQLSDNRMNWFISELFSALRSAITTLGVLQWDIIPNLRAPLRVTYLGQMTHWLSDILSIHFSTATAGLPSLSLKEWWKSCGSLERKAAMFTGLPWLLPTQVGHSSPADTALPSLSLLLPSSSPAN